MREKRFGRLATLSVIVLCCGSSLAQDESQRARDAVAEPGFQRIDRPGGVNLSEEFDLSDLRVPLEEIHTLLPVDGIPPLFDPETVPAAAASWPGPTDSVVVVTVGEDAYAAPISVLSHHEMINATIGGEPIGLTYCPLCESVSAFSRRIERTGDDPIVLEFGIAGSLYNSNMMMYDRTFRGLWSQLAGGAISGPMAGTELAHYPVRIVPFSSYVAEHPTGAVVTTNTGHDRPYEDGHDMSGYREVDDLLVPVRGIGDAMPRKVVGLGIRAGERAWFVPLDLIGEDGRTFSTPLGDVTARASGLDLQVTSAPEGVATMRTMYYSWSAFYPDTEIIGD